MKISWTVFGHPFAVWIIYKSHHVSSSILTPWPLISFSILILFFNPFYLYSMQVYPILVCPLSRWCHPTISSSATHFSSCAQSFPASGSLPISWLFASGGQSTGVSALASFLPKKSQGSSPSEWTGWISLQLKGLSRVFSNTTVQKHQFFSSQFSSHSNSFIHTRPLEKP